MTINSISVVKHNFQNNDRSFYHQCTSYSLFPLYVPVLIHTISPGNTIVCIVYMGSLVLFDMGGPGMLLDILTH